MELVYSNWRSAVWFLVGLAVFIYSFWVARRYRYDFISVLVRLIKSLPHHWRMLRDPVYRNKFRCIERFEKQVFDLTLAVASRNYLNDASDQELIEAFKVPPEHVGLVRMKLERALADEFDKSKKQAADYLAGLSDGDIATVAAYLNDAWYGGLIGPPAIDAWLRKERELASKSPVMAVGFLSRAPLFGGNAAPLA